MIASLLVPGIPTMAFIQRVAATAVVALAMHGVAAPVGMAKQLSIEPVLDGVVTTDPAWRDGQPMTDFTQVRPDEGAPASQRTEVRMGFTETTLYIGVVLYDDAPEGIIVTNSRRDSNLNDSDSFRVVIDSFLSQQTGFVFGTNPAGLQYDGQVVGEGTSRFGFGQGLNTNWDTTWEVVTHVGDFGWSAEFAIPFRSLRYGDADEQTWGVNFQRNVRRINEVSFWAPIPRQFELTRLTLAGSVTGIVVPSQRNFQFTPYGLASRSRGGTLAAAQDESEIGFDLKYSVTQSLTLDATMNTDFAQVEVDQQQVNFDRFNLFFPEKRPFFLENAGQFSVGSPGDIELFFSRRIGIAGNGTQIPIDGGARLSGKLGQSTNVGLLAMRTDAVEGAARATDFAVARVNQEFANRSTLGLLLVDRDDGATDNQTYAVDGKWGIGKSTTLSGFVAKTRTPDITTDDYAFRVGGSYDSQAWSFSGSYTEVAGGFNPEVGFLARRDYRSVSVFALRRIRPVNDFFGILEWSPHASYNQYRGFDGFKESDYLHIDSSIEWKNGGNAHTAINVRHEGVRNDFEISEGVVVAAGQYDDAELSVFAGTNQSAPLYAFTGLQVGGFFGGDRVSFSPGIGFRPNETLSLSLSWNKNDIELPGGDFDVALTRLRASYSFTPKISVQVLVQHNDRDEVLSTNLRFAWLQSANAGLYAVFNETDDERAAPGRPRREFILKYSRIVDF